MFGRSSGKIDLPSVPATLARVIQVTNKTDCTAEKVAQVVMLDQSLATKVLRLANSAYLGRRTKADTITEAVITLGYSSVRNLAASASVVDALFPKQLFAGFSWQEMWTHSVMCGLGAEAIHSRILGSSASSESAFVAGLLHDVGKLVMARALPHKFVQVVDACHRCGFHMRQAESNILGTDHCRIGGDLADQWAFPGSLIDGIRYHHAPEDAEEHEDLARAVQAANLLAKRMGRSYLVGATAEISLKDVGDCAGIRLADVEFVVEQVREGLTQSGEILAWATAMPSQKSQKAA